MDDDDRGGGGLVEGKEEIIEVVHPPFAKAINTGHGRNTRRMTGKTHFIWFPAARWSDDTVAGCIMEAGEMKTFGI